MRDPCDSYLFAKLRWIPRRKMINKIKEEIDAEIKGETIVVDDFNNSDGGLINVPTYVHDLFLPNKCQMGRLFEIFIVIILDKTLLHRLTKAIRGCNMSCFKVGASVGRPNWMTSLTIFNLIEFLREYSEDRELIFSRTNKED